MELKNKGVGRGGTQVGVALHEFRREFAIEPQNVLAHQDLALGCRRGTDPDWSAA